MSQASAELSNLAFQPGHQQSQALYAINRPIGHAQLSTIDVSLRVPVHSPVVETIDTSFDCAFVGTKYEAVCVAFGSPIGVAKS